MIVRKRKIAILGDMLELGDFSKELHEKVGEEVIKNKVDILITVGKEARNIAKVAKEMLENVYEYDNNEDAVNKAKDIVTKEDVILIKASNSCILKKLLSN